MFAVCVTHPDDPQHARVISLAAVSANDNPLIPPYRGVVEGADALQAAWISRLLYDEPVVPFDLAARPKHLVRMLDPLLNLTGPRHGTPARCSIHPTRWIDAEGCSACWAVKRERAGRRAWTAQVTAELAAAVAAATAGTAWRWDSRRPRLLAVRLRDIGPGWCGIALLDRFEAPVFLCCRPADHAAACSDMHGAATFDGTTFRAERGTHHAR